MIQVTPQMRVVVACEPADFRRGIDGLARLCREALKHDPLCGWMFVFRNRRASSGPHVHDLIANGMHFILGAKPGDHAFLFEQVEALRRRGRAPTLSRKEGNFTNEVSWVDGVPLNESNPDSRVDFLEYNENDADGKLLKRFTSISDLHTALCNAWLSSSHCFVHAPIERPVSRPGKRVFHVAHIA